MSSSLSLLKYALALLLPAAYLARRYLHRPQTASTSTDKADEKPVKSIMQAPRDDLLPPKDDPFTLAQLQAFDGSDLSKPIYVSIKGTVFDVSAKSDVYGHGRSYNIFAGKDGSKGLGMSSLMEEHAVPDYSGLNEADRKVLDDWHSFFTKRYNIVGRVIDLPQPVDPPDSDSPASDPPASSSL
ncbi:cytochrome b5-like heme/steroid binding domain-containing protein [Mycena sp. CBHHK59/15]|nr:cytochrome b5-like heme/steroid binding domain-containing protein [Mycena sp. CBHHK59/15]KAJ6628224.1 cytochrome b5-like heme/steroid binding domain-containing protein [Mycena sp. CBHHK59/15]